MTPLEMLTTRLAATVISNNSLMAEERILNFPEDAKAAIRVALHSTFPKDPSDRRQQERYETTKEAAKVIEDFYGGKL